MLRFAGPTVAEARLVHPPITGEPAAARERQKSAISRTSCSAICPAGSPA